MKHALRGFMGSVATPCVTAVTVVLVTQLQESVNVLREYVGKGVKMAARQVSTVTTVKRGVPSSVQMATAIVSLAFVSVLPDCLVRLVISRVHKTFGDPTAWKTASVNKTIQAVVMPRMGSADVSLVTVVTVVSGSVRKVTMAVVALSSVSVTMTSPVTM